jgi:S-adenosylmethionine/arginine decarboxylase-like enzyme
VTDARFNHEIVELVDLISDRLSDVDRLSAVVVAAAGAVGMFALGTPVVRESPRGIAIGMLCREGHIVLHTAPDDGVCLVDIVARAPADVHRGIEVIARRLSYQA